MKTVIALFVIASLLVTLVVFDQYFIAVQDRELKESNWVQDCKPPGPNEVVPSIGLYNNTHGFDLLTCTWYPSENGTPGLIESLYTSFVEPHILDLLYGFTFQYAYGAIDSDPDLRPVTGFVVDDQTGNTRFYPMDQLDKMPCEDFKLVFHSEMLQTEFAEIIVQKAIVCDFDFKGFTIESKNNNFYIFALIPVVIGLAALVLFWKKRK